MVQHDLRAYGLFRLFDLSKRRRRKKKIKKNINDYLDQNDIQRVMNIHDAKQIIETYQLWRSQLVFTIAERLHKNHLPIPISHTSVTSQIMCDEASGRRSWFFFVYLILIKIQFIFLFNLEELLNNNIVCTTTFDYETVKCTPRKGDWNGGDEILIMIPKLDKRKGNLF
jgi:hypothetical protein